jgi:hypothetical protein
LVYYDVFVVVVAEGVGPGLQNGPGTKVNVVLLFLNQK